MNTIKWLFILQLCFACNQTKDIESHRSFSSTRELGEVLLEMMKTGRETDVLDSLFCSPCLELAWKAGYLSHRPGFNQSFDSRKEEDEHFRSLIKGNMAETMKEISKCDGAHKVVLDSIYFGNEALKLGIRKMPIGFVENNTGEQFYPVRLHLSCRDSKLLVIVWVYEKNERLYFAHYEN